MTYIDKIISQSNFVAQQYVKEDFIFKEKDNFRGVYYIQKGQVKMLRNHHQKRMLVWFAEFGDFIGVSSFFTNSPEYTYSAEVHSETCEGYFISEIDFKSLLKEHPKLKERMIQVFCNRIAFTEDRIVKYKKENIKKKILDALLFFGKKGQLKNIPVKINFSISDLSEMIGATTTHIKRVLDEMEKQRLLKIDNQTITINDLAQLEKTL